MNLSAIPDERSHLFGKTRLDVAFSDIIRLYALIESDGNSSLHNSINSTLLRLLESSLLHDQKIQRIGSLWDSLGERADLELRSRISELLSVKTEDIPLNLIAYLSKLLSGSAFQKGRREINYSDFFDTLVDANIRSNKYKRLHCVACGYHFREADLGEERRAIAKDCRAVFATRTEPLRVNNTDKWKPQYIVRETKFETKKEYLTSLTIDHNVPEEGLGWSDSDNLQITCKLCNNGKMAYRRPLEALSLFAAGGLADYPLDRPWNTFKQCIVSFTFEFFERKCSICRSPAKLRELTVRPRKHTDETSEVSTSFAPWNFSSICYDCLPKQKP